MYNTLRSIIVSYAEIGNQAYITLFPLDEEEAKSVGSSEAQSHISFN